MTTTYAIQNLFDYQNVPLVLPDGMIVRASLDGRGQWQIIGDGRPLMTLALYNMSALEVCAFLNRNAAKQLEAK